jgi:myo-inositol-1(or 4)-monophosphatase
MIQTSQLKAWHERLVALTEEVYKELSSLLNTPKASIKTGSVGAGGDQTLLLDDTAEKICLNRLRLFQSEGEKFSVLSEEIGLVELGAPYPLVVIDPVDGSENARRGIDTCAISCALLYGPSFADVNVAVTRNLISGQCYSAIKGMGVYKNGIHVEANLLGESTYGMVALETPAPHKALSLALPVIKKFQKVRIIGSVALGLAYVSVGGVDLFLAPTRIRTLDVAPGFLLVNEAQGSVVTTDGKLLDDVEVGLNVYSSIVASRDLAIVEHVLSTFNA